jgi:hypothetical protein
LRKEELKNGSENLFGVYGLLLKVAEPISVNLRKKGTWGKRDLGKGDLESGKRKLL